MAGKLYLIPTPIGNLKEVSSRFFDVVNEVAYVACEDTRNTSKLLQLLGISKKCFSCHEHNENEASKQIIADLLSGKDIGYCSDAGYPCISDPGHLLVKKCIENNIVVVPISGPNAFLNALIGSGLDTDHFYFYGFLSPKSTQRQGELENLKNISSTLIFYEAPHRINETLLDMYKVLGNRNICVARELTKMYEEFIRTNLEDLTTNPREFKGELVVIVEGYKIETAEDDYSQYIKEVDELISLGLTTKSAIAALAAIKKINKNKLYKLYINKD